MKKPSTGMPKIIGSSDGMAKMNMDRKNISNNPSSNFRFQNAPHHHPADTTTTALSSSFDNTKAPLKSQHLFTKPADLTSSSFFKSAKTSQLQPLSLSSNKKITDEDDRQVINLQKISIKKQ